MARDCLCQFDGTAFVKKQLGFNEIATEAVRVEDEGETLEGTIMVLLAVGELCAQA